MRKNLTLFMTIDYAKARSLVCFYFRIQELQAQPFILVIQGRDKVIIDNIDIIKLIMFERVDKCHEQ